MKRRIWLLSFLIIFIFIVACRNKEENLEVKVFDDKMAIEVGEKYFQCLYENNIDEAKKLLSNELPKYMQNEDLGAMKINSYTLMNKIDSSDHIILNYNVSKSEKDIPRSILESYSIKIIKQDEDYKITEAKGKTLKVVYDEDGALYVRRDDEGSSDLLLRSKDIPKDMYKNGTQIDIKEEEIPLSKFSAIGISKTGGKIAIATTDEKDSYIAIVVDEEAKETFITDNNQSEKEKQKSIDNIIEKPVAQQINSIDIIKDSKSNKFIFDSKDEKLIVEYSKINEGDFLKIYNSSSREIIPLALDSKFSPNIYSVYLYKIDKDDIYIKVVSREGNGDNNTGIYKVDCEKLQLEKQ